MRILTLSCLAVALLGPALAVAAPPSCGSTITTNLTLDGNMVCNGTALTVGANGITINGAGFSITANNGYSIVASGYNNVTVTNVTLLGTSGHDGINATGQGWIIRNVIAQGRRYGVLVAGASTLVENSQFLNNAASGIYVYGGTGIAIKNNVLKGQTDWLFQLANASGAFTFTGNAFTGPGSAIRVDGCSGLTFDNLTAGNTFSNITGHGIYITASANIVVSNWTLSGVGANYGLYLAGSGHRISNMTMSNWAYGLFPSGNGITIENSNSSGNTTSGLRLDGGSSAIIRGNTLGNNTHSAIYLSGYSGALTLENNDLRTSGSGIYVGSSSGMTFDNAIAVPNRLGSNASYGIWGSGNSNMVVKNWDLSGGGRIGEGLQMTGSSIQVDNVIADDRNYGIDIGGDDIVIKNVKIRRSAWGIYLAGAANAAIRDTVITDASVSALRLSQVSAGIVLSGNDFRNSYRIVYCESCHDVTFDNAATGIVPNLLGNNTYYAFEMHTESKVTVRNWNFSGVGSGGITYNGSDGIFEGVTVSGRSVGIATNGSRNIVRNCVLTGNTSYNVYFAGAEGSALNNDLRGGGMAIQVNTYSGPFTWKGNDLQNAYYGFYHANVQNFVIEQPSSPPLNIFGNNTEGVSGGGNSDGVIIRNLDVSGSGVGYGVNSTGSNTVVTNVVANRRAQGIYLSGLGGKVIGNTVRQGTNYSVLVSLSGATVQDNDITGGTSIGLYIYNYTGPITFSNNDLRGTAAAVNVGSSRNVVIDNAPPGLPPNQFGNNSSSGISGNSESITIRNIDLSGASGDGINMDGVGITVDNVTADNRRYGVRVNGRNLTIKNSRMRNTREYGMIVYQAPATITNNVVTGAASAALYLPSYVGNATFTGNDLSGSYRGILVGSVLDFGFDNAVALNVFGDNAGCGICGSGSGMTFANLDVSGRGVGDGISLDGNNNVFRGITAKGRVSGIYANGRQNLVEDSLLRDVTYGFNVRGQGNTIRTSSVCWASSAGVYYDGSDVVEAKDNFWGTGSGPAYTTNSGGTGAPLLGTGAAFILYKPFRTTGTGCESNLPVRQFEFTGLVDAPAGTQQTATVRALDRYGAVVDGYTGVVGLSSTDLRAALQANHALIKGVGTFTVTLKTAGTQSVTASDVVTPQLLSTVAVKVLPNAAAPVLVVASGQGQTAAVGTTLPQPLRVRLTDAFDNPINGVTIAFSAASGGGSVSPPSAPTDASGYASTTATLGTVAGANRFNATLSGATGSPAAFDATAVPGEVSRLEVTGLPDTTVAGTSEAFHVRARDAFDNIVTAYTGPVQFSSADSLATVPAQASLTAGEGDFNVTFRTAGDQAVGVADVRYFAFRGSESLVVNAAAASKLALVSGNAQVATAGTAAIEPVIVWVTDAFGNPVKNVSVRFAATDQGSVSPATVASDVRGRASSVFTVGTTAGAHDFTASSTGLAGSPVNIQLVARAGPAAKVAYVSGGGLVGGVGQTLRAPLVAMATDSFGNRVGNAPILFAAKAPGASVSPASVPTDNAGIAQATAKLGTAAGVQVFEASADFAQNIVRYEETAIEGNAAKLKLVSGDGQTGPVLKTLPNKIKVRVEDGSGNPVRGAAVQFSTTVPGGEANPQVALTGLDGVAEASVTLGRTVGDQAFSASAPGLDGSPLALTFTAQVGGAARVRLTGPTGALAVGAEARVRIQIEDGDGNPIPAGTAVSLHADNDATFSGTTLSGAAGLGTGALTGTTDDTGAAEVTLTTLVAGSTTVTAGGGDMQESSLVVKFLAATADHLQLTLDKQATLACSCVEAAIQLVDAFGNPVSTALSRVTLDTGGSAHVSATTLVDTAPHGSQITGRLAADGSATATICGKSIEKASIVISQPQFSGRDARVEVDWQVGRHDPEQSLIGTLTTRLQTASGVATILYVPKDECGNPMGKGLKAVISSEGGRVTPTKDVGDGSYSAELRVDDCPAGETPNVRVFATLDGDPSAKDLRVPVECVPFSPEKTEIELSASTVDQCDDRTKHPITARVTVRDASGAVLVTPRDVKISAPDVDEVTLTLEEGTYTGTLVATKCSPDAKVLKVSVNGAELAKPDLKATFRCAPVDLKTSGITLDRQEIRGDGIDATKVTVAATTTCGEPAHDRPVTLAVTLGKLGAATGTLDAAGAFATDLLSDVEGLDKVKATVDGVDLGEREVKYRAPVRYGGGVASCDCTSPGAGAGLMLSFVAGLVRRRRR